MSSATGGIGLIGKSTRNKMQPMGDLCAAPSRRPFVIQADSSLLSAIGKSRDFAATQHFSRLWGEADLSKPRLQNWIYAYAA